MPKAKPLLVFDESGPITKDQLDRIMEVYGKSQKPSNEHQGLIYYDPIKVGLHLNKASYKIRRYYKD